jgi:thiosulfate reductase cytochrome b subunit
MADTARFPQIVTETAPVADAPRHLLFVRVTHWIQALSFLVLLLSGIAILLAHPRLYWGEVGNLNTPSLIDLPLPFVLEIPIRGPGRYLHFLFAWISVFTGVAYLLMGLWTRHFGKDLLPARRGFNLRAMWAVVRNHLQFKRSRDEELASYNILQRLAYSAVVFLLAPLLLWTGLAMSPAVTSVFPFLATLLGGQQSARTIHFFAACALVLFFLIHVAMVWQSGFKRRVGAMLTGGAAKEGE